MSTTTRNAGFTLVELAIVLVIIGLLVGGVLVGQDLIKAAEINSTATQLTKYDTAANTFRTRFSGYPGDIRNPARYPLAAANATGASGQANGDNVIQPPAGCTNVNGYAGESALYWTHLSQSNLIPEAVNTVTDYTGTVAGGVATITDGHLPQARLGNGNRFHITSVGGRNFYVMANFSAATATTCALANARALTAIAAFQLDTKIDDGNAATGSTVSVADAGAPTAVGGGSATPDLTGNDDCYATATGAYATTTDALSSQLACMLRVRASF